MPRRGVRDPASKERIVETARRCIDAGAQFGLSPSLNKTICEEAKQLNFSFIPGVMTPSEIEFAHQLAHSLPVRCFALHSQLPASPTFHVVAAQLH